MSARVRERRFVQQLGNNFVELLVREHGETGSTETVVFVHDYFGNSLDFHEAGRFLASCGLKALAMDLPGRGCSAALPEDGYGLLRLASCVVGAVQECAGQHAILVGKGWGGVVGALAILMAPGLFRSIIFLDTMFDWSAVDREALSALRDVACERFSNETALAEAIATLPADWFPEIREGSAAMAQRAMRGPDGVRLALDPSAVEFVLNANDGNGEFSNLVARLKHPQAHLLSSPDLRSKMHRIEEKLPASGRMSVFNFDGRGWRLDTREELMILLGAVHSTKAL